MNKIIFILANIITITLASEVSALPLFARQTGMVCSACHFQHFPILNGFGRAFKSAGYTMISGQGKVEDEGLTIPNVLNMAALITSGYEKSNQAGGTAPQKTTGDGAFYMPGAGGELSLYFGGRVSENAGALVELYTGGTVAGSVVRGAQGSAKIPILFILEDDTRAGFIPFSTDKQGASYGFELLNTGANAVHLMNASLGLNGAHSSVLSAQQYLGTATPATGVALVVNNPNGFINVTKYDQIGISRGTLASLGSTYVRVAGMTELAGWDAGLGIQSWSGTSATTGNQSSAPVYADTNATAIDGQIQGRVGIRPVGLYASYAIAPAGTNNVYNTDAAAAMAGSNIVVTNGTNNKSAFNISAEMGVIPEKATVGAAIRRGKSGVALGGSSNASDNAIMLVATYKLAQNVMGTFSYTNASGEYWDEAHQNALGSVTTTINLFASF